jgi:hypothetical protein
MTPRLTNAQAKVFHLKKWYRTCPLCEQESEQKEFGPMIRNMLRCPKCHQVFEIKFQQLGGPGWDTTWKP